MTNPQPAAAPAEKIIVPPPGTPDAAPTAGPGQGPPPPTYIGELRRDLQLFPCESDRGGHCDWTLYDPVSGRYYRIEERRYRILSCMDQNYTLEEFLQKLDLNGIHTNRQDIQETLNFLRMSGLLLPEYGVDAARLEKTKENKQRLFYMILLNSYLFLRIPLLKPDRFLNETQAAIRSVFNRWTLLLLAIIALSGYISLVPNWHRLTEELLQSISLEGLLRYSLAVILIKCVHEFAHAYVAKNYGIRVRRMGVAFIVFFPRLYTDLTDAWRINDRKHRFLIDAAGILSEVVIGGIGALVWANSGPGSAHTVAYYVFAVSIINTVLVNGNPFIRYDGYYMLMDMVGIDNLQRRGTEMFRALFRRSFFGLNYPVERLGEEWRNHFTFLFGIASFIYRFFLYTSIILIVYFQFTKTIGIVLLMLEFWLLLVKPLTMEVKSLMAQKKEFKRRNLMIAYAILAVILLPLIVPLPWTIDSPCEVRSMTAAMIYVQNSGRLAAVAVKDGDTVKKDQLLFRFESPELEWQYRQTLLQKSSLRAEIDQLQSTPDTLGGVKVKQQQLKAADNQLEELIRRRDLMTVRAPFDGVVAFSDPDLRPGKIFTRGEMLAEIYDPGQLRVLGYVKEEHIDRISPDDDAAIAIDNVLGTIPGKVAAANPVPAELVLPGPLLSLFGGPLPARRAETGGFELLSPYYQVAVIPENSPLLRYGSTGTLQIKKYSSVGWTLLRKVIAVLQQELSF